ncbi:MAG: hypothetical protein ACR2M0_03595 [Chloroflexia bacterium]
MKKAINMQAQIQVGHSDGAGTADALVQAFAAANPGMTLTVKSLSPPDAAGNATARVYIEGEQPPPDNFAALAGDALHKAVAHLSVSEAGLAPTSAPLTLRGVQEVGNDDEDTGVVLPPQHTAAPATPLASPAASPPVTPTQLATSAPTPASLAPTPAPPTAPAAPAPDAPAASPTAGPTPVPIQNSELNTQNSPLSHRHQHKNKSGGHTHSG